jgi:hypothetical protein
MVAQPVPLSSAHDFTMVRFECHCHEAAQNRTEVGLGQSSESPRALLFRPRFFLRKKYASVMVLEKTGEIFCKALESAGNLRFVSVKMKKKRDTLVDCTNVTCFFVFCCIGGN